MTNMELILSMLAEESTREISAATRPDNMIDHHKVAASGGGVARNARIEIEQKTGRKVISPLKSSAKWSAEAFGEGGYEVVPPEKEEEFRKMAEEDSCRRRPGCMPMIMWQLAHRRKDRPLGSCEVRS
jgi:hypothetical protein